MPDKTTTIDANNIKNCCRIMVIRWENILWLLHYGIYFSPIVIPFMFLAYVTYTSATMYYPHRRGNRGVYSADSRVIWCSRSARTAAMSPGFWVLMKVTAKSVAHNPWYFTCGLAVI